MFRDHLSLCHSSLMLRLSPSVPVNVSLYCGGGTHHLQQESEVWSGLYELLNTIRWKQYDNNIWHCNEYVIQFMTSYYHIYACCWVRRDLFLLWQLIANKWTWASVIFLSIVGMLIIFNTKLECSSKRRNEKMKENSNTCLFPLVEY